MRYGSHLQTVARALGLAAVVIFIAASANAQTFVLLHTFTGGGDGGHPNAGLTIQGSNFYGTTCEGGSSHKGAVYGFQMRPNGPILTTLYSFRGGADGSCPLSRVIVGPDGALYGTTNQGGGAGACSNGCGTVFKLQPPIQHCAVVNCPWTETVLYTFQGGADGGAPEGGDLTFDSAGVLYGTTLQGGTGLICQTGCGTVFKLTHSGRSWTEAVVYNFTGGSDGARPSSGVVVDAAGNIFGTAYFGGTSDNGVVFELSPSGGGWMETILHLFSAGTDGAHPIGGLTFDASGNLYGTTSAGGASNTGIAFLLARSGGGWNYQKIYDFMFNRLAGGPTDRLTLDAAGNVYGTTTFDPTGGGDVFRLDHGTWHETDLHVFDYACDDGCSPEGSVVFDAQGNLYSTTQAGGFYRSGTIFEVMP